MRLGDLKIVRNLFLEKEELNRFEEFLSSKLYTYLLKNTKYWGVIGGTDAFKVYAGTNPESIKFIEESFAIDKNINFIYLPVTDNIDCSTLTDSLWYWIKISHATTNYETGTVNVDIKGNLSGANTLFLDVLRGQSAKAPSRISLYENDVKLGDYEVIDVGSDTTAIINSSFAVGKTGLKYAVTGTFTLGESIQEADKNIFIYDSCTISFVLETDTPPTLTADEEFFIARIRNVSGALTIQDKRTNYTYKTKGEFDASDALKQSNNLSDVSSTSSSRTNLDVYSKAESSTLWDNKWNAEKLVDQWGVTDAIKGNWNFRDFTKYLWIYANATATDPGISPGTIFPSLFIQVSDDGANERVGIVLQTANNTAGYRHIVFITQGGAICSTITQLDTGGISLTGVRKIQFVNAFNAEKGSIQETTIGGGGYMEYRGEVHERDTTIGIDTASASCDFDTVTIEFISIKRLGARLGFIRFVAEAEVKAGTVAAQRLVLKLDKTLDLEPSDCLLMGAKEERTVAGVEDLTKRKPALFLIEDGNTIQVIDVNNDTMAENEKFYFQFSGTVPLASEYGDLTS